MKKLANHDVFNGKEKVFNVSIYKDGAWISDHANTWKLFFRTGTYECGMLFYLISNKHLEDIHKLILAMYYSRLSFRSIVMVKAIYSAADDYAKDAGVTNNDDDAKIVAEEKVLHEQTLESISELEKLKRDGK